MKRFRAEIENILIRMMPAAPVYPTLSLAEADRRSRLNAIEKATNQILYVIARRNQEVFDSSYNATRDVYGEGVVERFKDILVKLDGNLDD